MISEAKEVSMTTTALGHGRLEDRLNNFTALRIGFAFLILYGHSLMIPQGLPMEGTWASVIDTIVQYALDGFFILSGYMLAASLAKSQDMTSYWLARSLRIFPGLVIVVFACWLLLGPIMTNLSISAYFASSQSWAYPFLTLSQLNPQGELQGVFEHNAINEINRPLWTIRYELVCYVLAGVAAGLGVWRQSWGIPAIFAASLIASFSIQVFTYTGPLDETAGAMARFGPAFMTGALFYRLKHLIALTAFGSVLVLLLAYASFGTPAGIVVGQLANAYVLLWLGFKKIPGSMGRQVRDVKDISYGVYILHWPIGQMAVALNPGIGIGTLFAVMASSTLIMAIALRHFVEEPALRAKPALRVSLNSAINRSASRVVYN
ncbi:acyltransferase family protein [Henriciella marina]|uniref:Acyltransferase n=1 Tax=Henriciella marina TaxID=453851 RepID=A0ABT4LPZ6_9PROT|nr:acyltransferase [Henriciella marina]MCZ4296430.1 acyltransferase [Henriciella marina]